MGSHAHEQAAMLEGQTAKRQAKQKGMPEGWSNKSWPVFQFQDFYLRGVSPMTLSSKNFEKILE